MANPPLTNDKYAEWLRQKAMTELAAIIDKAKADAKYVGIGTREWRQTVALMDGLNRAAGWPAQRTLAFVSKSSPRRWAALNVRVVSWLDGGPGQITAEQEAAMREIEEQNDGAIPLTEKEWKGLTEGGETFAAVARRESSPLHHLCYWDDKIAAELLRFNVMHGTGNAREPLRPASRGRR